jgi:hypothetical protein
MTADSKEFIFRISKEDLTQPFMQNLMHKVRLEEILKKSNLSQNEIFEITELSKQSWWDENKSWVLDKINSIQ